MMMSINPSKLDVVKKCIKTIHDDSPRYVQQVEDDYIKLTEALVDWMDEIETTVNELKRSNDNPSVSTKTYNDFSFIHHEFVTVNGSTITFQIQDGPIKEHGVNGCQIDDMIIVAKEIIESFNGKFPCDENASAIEYLDSALYSLGERKKNREQRGVEGHDKE
jgi:hypothetical protein